MTAHKCKHMWKPDMEELVCTYCGTRLYRNEDPLGPKWRLPIDPSTIDIVPEELAPILKTKKGPRKLPRH